MERHSFWTHVLAQHVGKTVEIHVAKDGAVSSLTGVLEDGCALFAERAVKDQPIGQNAAGETIMQRNVVPETRHMFNPSDILEVIEVRETPEAAVVALREAGKLPEDSQQGSRIAMPSKHFRLPRA